ncbi:hypothetical protein [Sphingomonas sp. R86520]|uniref:hypothetical protein n=1 Tax=Sphingomonas sp. R86520 TaxID=3093859 RepID=UPI0036D2409D
MITVDREGGLLTGLGTAFKADPFGTFVTAEHVLQDHFEDESRAASVATVLYPIRLVYGKGTFLPSVMIEIRQPHRPGTEHPAGKHLSALARSDSRSISDPSKLAGMDPSKRLTDCSFVRCHRIRIV